MGDGEHRAGGEEGGEGDPGQGRVLRHRDAEETGHDQAGRRGLEAGEGGGQEAEQEDLEAEVGQALAGAPQQAEVRRLGREEAELRGKVVRPEHLGDLLAVGLDPGAAPGLRGKAKPDNNLWGEVYAELIQRCTFKYVYILSAMRVVKIENTEKNLS